MRRARWVLFIAAGVWLLFGRVMYAVQQDARRSATGLIADAVTEAQAEFAAEESSKLSPEVERGLDLLRKRPRNPYLELLERDRRERDAVSDAERAVRQSVQYITLTRRQDTVGVGYVIGVTTGGLLGVIWFGSIIPLLLRPIPRLLRSIGIAYHKTAVTTVRGSIRSSRAVRKHVRNIVDEATEDET